MIVAIAGGHGQIAQLLERQLSAQGHESIGLVRNADHVAELERNGARGTVIDLEQASVDEVATAIGIRRALSSLRNSGTPGLTGTDCAIRERMMRRHSASNIS